ncbi:MAG: hypothetical protein H0U78_03020 [Rickettsiaceae bacterium]|nr:hypothetical protein [Rickettsiaceae bacterium]
MKIVSKILALIILVFAGFYGLFLGANMGKLNQPIKTILEYFLNVELVELRFKDSTLSSKEVIILSRTGKLLISDLNIHIGYSPDSFDFTIDPGRICITNNEDELIVDAKYFGKFTRSIFKNNYSTQLNFSEIVISDLMDIHKKPYNNGLVTYSNRKSAQGNHIAFDLNFDNSILLHAGSDQDSGKIKITGKNIPLGAYTIFEKIAPDNGLVEFFQKFVKNGHITEMDFLLDINREILTKDSLIGKAKIQTLDFSYDPDLPQLKNIDMDIDVLDSDITFKINRAYSSDIILSQGLILMNWKGLDDTELKITAKARGPATGLTDFIMHQQHQEMNKANIDLRKIIGQADLDINIDIPLKPGTKNIYNISANITKASLSIFKNYVKLTNATIKGIFNGEEVLLSGTGKINNFNSNLDFVLNLADKTKFSHKLDINTHFKISNNLSDTRNKIAFISLLGGSSVLDFTYTNKDSKGIIAIDADITNLDLYFDKLGIRKKQNDKSKLIVTGTFTDPTSGQIDFSVSSTRGLKTTGTIHIDSNKATADIREIKHKKTDLSAKIVLDKNLFDANIHGKILDLSEADMLHFLEKERDGGSTKLALSIDRIRLKDNIWLDNVKAKFECDPLRCFSGYIDSKIGSRSLEVLLTAKQDKEEWLINCSNAGALLRGLDMYDSMRAGNLTLNLTTSRKEVKPGHIIPIHSGKFSFERFMLHDATTMTRMISFISLPGFIGMISGNKNITFLSMTGDFSFQNNILSITSSSATGPYFDFTLKGKIDTKKRFMDIYGHVNPELYGISSVIGSIPIIGRIFTGNKNHQGLVSKSYSLKEKY